MSSPPSVDEAYWAALLQEGEVVHEEEAPPEDWFGIETTTTYQEPLDDSPESGLPRASDWEEMRRIMDTDTSVEAFRVKWYRDYFSGSLI